MTGAGYTVVRTPSIIEEETDPNDPTEIVALHVEFVRRSAAARSPSYKIRMEGTTDNVNACYLVGERIDIG